MVHTYIIRRNSVRTVNCDHWLDALPCGRSLESDGRHLEAHTVLCRAEFWARRGWAILGVDVNQRPQLRVFANFTHGRTCTPPLPEGSQSALASGLGQG